MTDPFIIRDDEIHDRALRDTESTQWVENVSPRHIPGAEIEYLKPTLKRKRFSVLFVIVLAVLGALFARASQLQVVQGKTLRSAAESNRVRVVRIKAPRGAILDRNSIALTENVPRFALVLSAAELPAKAQERNRTLKEIAERAQVPYEDIVRQFQASRFGPLPLTLKSGLSYDEALAALFSIQHIRGISLEIQPARSYPRGAVFSHVLGYLGKIAPDDVERMTQKGYALDDLVGKTGLEAQFENNLRGHDGARQIEINAQGKVQRTVAEDAPQDGAPLLTTIDAGLQEKAHAVLAAALKAHGKTRGALVALDPKNGAVRALVSLPAYDNNIFVQGAVPLVVFRALSEDPDRPLFPRAIAGTYPSGSTIKPAVAAAGLQDGVITAGTTVLSVGGLEVGQWFFPDWKIGGHGMVEVKRALAESVNTFFYMVGGGYGERKGLGIEKLAEYLRGLGFGSRTGIELNGESEGLVPTPDWKEQTKTERWYIGDTYHLAIGQGDILVTPLQIAQMTAYFANGGKWVKPYLTPICHPERSEGSLANASPTSVGDSSACGLRMTDNGPNIDLAHIQTIRQGLREAVLYGSARSLLALPVSAAGKTGTAQWSTAKSPHAWFTGWAPYENPDLAITVLVEEGGEGSSIAVPIAKEIWQWWTIHKQELDTKIAH